MQRLQTSAEMEMLLWTSAMSTLFLKATKTLAGDLHDWMKYSRKGLEKLNGEKDIYVAYIEVSRGCGCWLLAYFHRFLNGFEFWNRANKL